MNIPKIIWILWLQGEKDAPYVVKKCIASWREKNPSWKINVLDKNSIYDYLTDYIANNKIPFAQQSDIIRLKLLQKYGGVWADSTSFCNKPLDNWISTINQSNFFMFYKPGKDRLISNWFIISSPKNPLVNNMLHSLESYWASFTIKPKFLNNYRLVKILSFFYNRNISSTKHWLGYIPRKLLGIYPYFIFHYLFANLVEKNISCKNVWQKTPKISADGPHIIQELGIYTDATDEILRKIKNDDMPLYKLTWKYDKTKCNPNSLLEVLLNEPNKS